MKLKTCLYCDEELGPNRKKFCSRKCRNEKIKKENLKIRNCAKCGTPFESSGRIRCNNCHKPKMKSKRLMDKDAILLELELPNMISFMKQINHTGFKSQVDAYRLANYYLIANTTSDVYDTLTVEEQLAQMIDYMNKFLRAYK